MLVRVLKVTEDEKCSKYPILGTYPPGASARSGTAKDTIAFFGWNDDRNTSACIDIGDGVWGYVMSAAANGIEFGSAVFSAWLPTSPPGCCSEDIGKTDRCPSGGWRTISGNPEIGRGRIQYNPRYQLNR